jgi:hypothetical protein
MFGIFSTKMQTFLPCKGKGVPLGRQLAPNLSQNHVALTSLQRNFLTCIMKYSRLRLPTVYGTRQSNEGKNEKYIIIWQS